MKKLLSIVLLLTLGMGLFASLPTGAAEGTKDPADLFATATWEKGSFYDAATPNLGHESTRRYTVLSCKEGDVFTFKMPSTNWRLYLYPADANGSIDKTWFELKDGMEYTVTAINGKMPTTMRITACPNPDGQITDDMWKKFDVSCFLKVPTDLFAEATWEKGSFYDAAAPNLAHEGTRRYTVLSCKEGDVFTFKMPSTNWRLYLYPADANGSIDKTWFELKDGMEYIVKAINGKMPTTLRITACPNPDGQITDDMWAKFDVQCFVADGAAAEKIEYYNLFKTAEWKLGSYYGNAVHGGKDRRHAIFPCKLNDTFKFDFTGSAFGLWVYYYDQNGELTDFGYTTVTEDTEIKITEKNGKVPSELRISVYPIAGGDITDAMWEEFDVACTQTSDYITVATMNYGLWNDGVTKYVPADKVDTVLAAWKKMLDDNDPDILAGQEWLKYFDRNLKMTAEDHVFAYKYKYQFATADGFGKNLVSKFEITDFKVTPHTKNGSRMYTTAYAMINGRKVCLINAHLSIETDFNTNRKAEYADLLKVMEQEEYVIVFGDFNAYTVSEFNVFKKAGYSVVNGGKFGTFKTWTNFDKPSSWTNKAIDNIIVSPNIEILSAKVDRRDLSDHNMLVAELRLLDKAPDPSTDTSTNTSSKPTGTVTNTNLPTTNTDTNSGTETPVDENKSPIGWIVGGIAAVLAIAAACFFAFRKKSPAAGK